MKILIVAIHYPICSARYLADAFRRNGHDVRTVGNTTDHLWGQPYDPRWTWHSNGDPTTHWDHWTPDLIILSESAWEYRHPSYDTPMVIFGADNHVRDYRQAGVARYFLAHKAVSIQPWDEAICEWLPGAYDPVWMRPSPLPYAEREFDVCLVGYQYPQRTALVQALVKAGVKVFASTGLLYSDYAAAYHQARMALCVSAGGDVGQRIFENAVLGCLVLTDPLPDLPALNPKGLQVYESADALVNVVKHYLRQPDLAQQEMKAGQAWALQYSWDARARAIETWYNETYTLKDSQVKRGNNDGYGDD